MNSPDSNSTRSALDEIEREIIQIDQLVRSWSHGKTLRFDRAHVRQTPPESKKPVQPSRQPVRWPQRLFFILNVIGFGIPLCLVAAPNVWPGYSPGAGGLVLTVGLMVVAGGNLFLAAWSGSSEVRRHVAPRSEEPSSGQRNPRLPASSSSRN